MVLDSLGCTLHLLHMVGEHGEDLHTRPTGTLLEQRPMETARAYFLHLIQLLAVACQRRTKMWLFSS